MKRYFTRAHTVRYDECDCNTLLTPTAFVRYMQDIASQDVEDAQLPGEGHWLVKRTLIDFAAPIPIHTRLELKTFGISFKRITSQRGYEARLADSPHSEPLISARTLWVYIDARGKPARIPEEIVRVWLPDGPEAPLSDPPFPAPPERTPETSTTTVRFSDIDLMHHMNNAAVVEALDNAAWEMYARHGIRPDTTRFEPLHYDIEYMESPAFGDSLNIQSWLEPADEQIVTLHQQIVREGKVMARACSQWKRFDRTS